jgi:hypothetical protein
MISNTTQQTKTNQTHHHTSHRQIIITLHLIIINQKVDQKMYKNFAVNTRAVQKYSPINTTLKGIWKTCTNELKSVAAITTIQRYETAQVQAVKIRARKTR